MQPTGLVLDLDDIHFDDAARGAFGREMVALLAAQESRADRTFVGNLARGDIGFRRADDGEDALAATHVHGDRAADVHAVGALGGFDQNGVGENVVDLRLSLIHI